MASPKTNDKMRLNAMIKLSLVAVLTTLIASGCEDACEKTELGRTINVGFILRAEVSGPNGSQIVGQTVEFRIYKEPCGQLPKGHFGGTAITDQNGYAQSPVNASYNLDNGEDLVVATATFIDGVNPSQTKTKTFRGGQLISLDGSGQFVDFDFNL